VRYGFSARCGAVGRRSGSGDFYRHQCPLYREC